MATIRLSNYHREEIVKIAMAHAFDEREKTLIDEEKQLIEEIYAEYIPLEIKKLLDGVPKVYLNTRTWINVINKHGFRLQFNFDDRKVCSDETDFYPSNELCNKIWDHDARWHELKREIKDARIKLYSILNTISTFNKLKELWPDGAPFYNKVIFVDPDKAKLPAVVISDINKTFGLPIEA